MTQASDAAEPEHLTQPLTWLEQVKLHMRAHNSAPLTSQQHERLQIARANGVEPWAAFDQIVGADNVQF
ncbi:hypothetical protein B0W47_00520 [Komagataeibacter nataicola]|uniref:Uncharacterized protein n=1 Tax=Komagataeibacter nataicola TaxID=265960 RepID=A0A9N7C3K6_9PROT|nr:hypothetical protein [Komagataeibacter nataicola]AQU86186.1 hypothetical protein B0W47_00520 [Komagataeibacter nataicola]PYD65321.1 hypothetical protein CDI09_14025 [Komagataeibacter nataicola]WNM08412.1 hypothetical protein RI056_16365 [Komagataeibacter nataicola]GBR22986.1 hypothetical protein AA0616_2413 [Komagataeibacter nataicola NRIC 0616]